MFIHCIYFFYHFYGAGFGLGSGLLALSAGFAPGLQHNKLTELIKLLMDYLTFPAKAFSSY